MNQSTGERFASTVLLVTLLFAPVLMVRAATDNWNVEGENGILHVHGTLSESACRLDMTSTYQDVWLGNIGSGTLARAGDRSTPVTVQLRLFDCVRSPARSQEMRMGGVSWSRHQPAVSVVFVATADKENPELVRVSGAQGVGVRVLDALHRDIRLGSRGIPLFVSPGDDALTYYVMLERTPAELAAGAFQASMDFRLSYD